MCYFISPLPLSGHLESFSFQDCSLSFSYPQFLLLFFDSHQFYIFIFQFLYFLYSVLIPSVSQYFYPNLHLFVCLSVLMCTHLSVTSITFLRLFISLAHQKSVTKTFLSFFSISLCLNISPYLSVHLSIQLLTHISISSSSYLWRHLCFFICFNKNCHISMFLSLSLSPFISKSLSVCLSACLLACLPAYLSISFSFDLFVFLSVCLSICLYIYLSVCQSLSVLPVCLPACLSLSL